MQTDHFADHFTDINSKNHSLPFYVSNISRPVNFLINAQQDMFTVYFRVNLFISLQQTSQRNL